MRLIYLFGKYEIYSQKDVGVTTSGPEELNEYVRDILSPFLEGRYLLSQQGQEKVISANAKLDKDYARAHLLPVADWSYRELRDRLQELPPREFGEVLDVCAGTGFVSLNIMRRRLFKKCVALDLNPEALKILADRARTMGIDEIEIQTGNIMATEFQSNRFDVIMGNSFLHHLPDVPTFLKEMFRILKPGGVLCITGEPSPSAMKWQNYFQRRIMAIQGKRHWPKGEIPLTDIWQFSTDGLERALRGVGFSEIRIDGFGRWSESLLSLIDRFWVRVTGHSAPSWIWRSAYALRHIESRHATTPDQMAILAVRARKP